MHVIVKIVITALLVAAVSEAAKRATWIAAILAALPVTSILAMTWLYADTQDAQKVADLSRSIFWAVLPSLLFFLVLPKLISAGIRFVPAMLIASTVMAGAYFVYAAVLKKFGLLT